MLQATETICLHKMDRDMSNVPSKVRKCTVPPDHSRSEILFLCTSNIPNLISYVYRTAFEMSHWLSVDVFAQLHVH